MEPELSTVGKVLYDTMLLQGTIGCNNLGLCLLGFEAGDEFRASMLPSLTVALVTNRTSWFHVLIPRVYIQSHVCYIIQARAVP